MELQSSSLLLNRFMLSFLLISSFIVLLFSSFYFVFYFPSTFGLIQTILVPRCSCKGLQFLFYSFRYFFLCGFPPIRINSKYFLNQQSSPFELFFIYLGLFQLYQIFILPFFFIFLSFFISKVWLSVHYSIANDLFALFLLKSILFTDTSYFNILSDNRQSFSSPIRFANSLCPAFLNGLCWSSQSLISVFDLAILLSCTLNPIRVCQSLLSSFLFFLYFYYFQYPKDSILLMIVFFLIIFLTASGQFIFVFVDYFNNIALLSFLAIYSATGKSFCKSYSTQSIVWILQLLELHLAFLREHVMPPAFLSEAWLRSPNLDIILSLLTFLLIQYFVGKQSLQFRLRF